jgi:hypothetical protein
MISLRSLKVHTTPVPSRTILLRNDTIEAVRLAKEIGEKERDWKIAEL